MLRRWYTNMCLPTCILQSLFPGHPLTFCSFRMSLPAFESGNADQLPPCFLQNLCPSQHSALLPKLWSKDYGGSEVLPNLQTIMFDRSVFIDAIWKHLTRESEITNNLSFPEIALASASALVYQCQSPHCRKENWRRLHLIKLNFFSMIFHHFLYREAAVFVIKPFLEKHGSSNVHLIVFVTFMGHKRVFERYFPVVTHLF